MCKFLYIEFDKKKVLFNKQWAKYSTFFIFLHICYIEFNIKSMVNKQWAKYFIFVILDSIQNKNIPKPTLKIKNQIEELINQISKDV